MKIDHIAVASNTEKDADKFYIELLGLKKTRSFKVIAELMEKFFSVNKECLLIRYENEEMDVEVFVTDDDSKVQDIYTHNCLLVEDPEELVSKANSMGYITLKISRKDSGYYYFLKDLYENLYEIKKIM